jgi:hypothetical protein
MPSINHVDDYVVDTIRSTGIVLRRAVITTDGPTTGTGPLRARSLDLAAGASIP